jgi:hypothetical protein
VALAVGVGHVGEVLAVELPDSVLIGLGRRPGIFLFSGRHGDFRRGLARRRLRRRVVDRVRRPFELDRA